jgi:hypothetical protein
MRQTNNMRDDGCSCLFRVGSILARGKLRFMNGVLYLCGTLLMCVSEAVLRNVVV